MKQADEALNTVNRYLYGDDQAFLDFETTPTSEFDTVFFNTHILCGQSPSLKLEVEALLAFLGVPQEERDKYVNSTSTTICLLRLLAKRPKQENAHAHEKLDDVIRKIDNFQMVRSLCFFENHLATGGTKAQLLNYLTSYDKKMAKVNADFYTTTINSDPAILDAVKNILASLGASKKLGRYIGTSLTVHECLQELINHTNETDENKEKLVQLKVLVKSIETKSKISWQKAFLYGLLTLFPIVASMPFGGFSVIEQIVTAALFMPIAGLVVTVGIGLYSLYTTTFNKNITLFDKIRDNFFILADTALNVIKHSLVIASVATATPVTAILSVAAMGVSVLHQGFKLLQMKFQGSNKPNQDGSDDPSIKKQDARFYSDYEKGKKRLWVDFFTAVALTGIVAAACFVPGGAVVIASAAAAAVFTYLVKWSVERHITNSSQESLRVAFDEIERTEEAATKPGPSSVLTNSATLLERLQRGPVPSPYREDTPSSGYRTGCSTSDSAPITPDTPVDEDFSLRKGHFSSGLTYFGKGELVGDVFLGDKLTQRS